MVATVSEPTFADLQERALRHAQRGDLDAALHAWGEIRTQFPDSPAGYVGLARALRRVDRLDEAESLLREAAGRFTDNASIVLERARAADARQDWQEAARRWRTATSHQPNEPRNYSNTAVALRRAGRLDEAENLLAEAAARFPGDILIAGELARLASAQQNWPEAARRWQVVIKCQPTESRAYLAAATALRHAGRFDEAEDLLAQAAERFSEDHPITLERAQLANARLTHHIHVLVALRQTDGLTDTDKICAIAAARNALARAKGAGDSDLIRRLEFQVALTSGDWHLIRSAAEHMIALDASPTTHTYAQLAQACWQLDDLKAAELAASRAIEIDPDNAHAALILTWITAERGDPEAVLSHFRRLADLAPNNSRWAMEVVRVLHLSGRIEEAVTELNRVKVRWPDEPLYTAWQLNHGLEQADTDRDCDNPAKDKFVARITHELRNIQDAAPGAGALRRPLIVDDNSKDVLVAAVSGTETGILVFTGPHDHLTVPIALFDRYLAPFGVSVIYLKDFQRLAYLRGIRSLGGYDATITGLRQLLHQLGIRYLRTLGVLTSAAIRYGVDLGATCAVGFDVIGSSRLQATQLAPFRNMFRTRLVANVAEQDLDLRSFLETKRHNCAIKLVYSRRMPFMAAQAERLADLPGVELHPQLDIKQQVLRMMAAKSNFIETLRTLLQLPDR